MPSDNRAVYESQILAEAYAREDALQPPKAAILQILKPYLSGKRMLDLGVGGGRTTQHFAPLVGGYVGADYAEHMVATCETRFAGAPWKMVFAVANACELLFDDSAVDFLEKMDVPPYKIASLQVVDMLFLRKVASTGKPVIMSSGTVTLDESTEAVDTLRRAGAKQIALFKCTTAYPAPPEEMNLATIPAMQQKFQLPVGLSDHTMGVAMAAAVVLGAGIVEKHLCLSRSDAEPNSAFSPEPREFKEMVDAVLVSKKAVGKVHFGLTKTQEGGRIFHRSLFVVRDIKACERFTPYNIRSIRPGHGLHTRHYEEILGPQATRDIERGTLLSWKRVKH